MATITTALACLLIIIQCILDAGKHQTENAFLNSSTVANITAEKASSGLLISFIIKKKLLNKNYVKTDKNHLSKLL